MVHTISYAAAAADDAPAFGGAAFFVPACPTQGLPAPQQEMFFLNHSQRRGQQQLFSPRLFFADSENPTFAPILGVSLVSRRR
jgi:hypothetical protein